MRQIFICYATIHLILLVSTVQCNGEESESVSTNTNRRRGSSGLISMPRVGRSDMTWSFQSQGDAVPASMKNRRGSSGLIAMPRVGRGFLTLAPGMHIDPSVKSKCGPSGLIAMPRVGRSDLMWPLPDAVLDEDGGVVSMLGKRGGGGSGETSGMWFGPRLGKRNKRSLGIPWTVFSVREFPADVRDYTPRLGRESEEQKDCPVEETQPQSNIQS